jgi:spore maturation protein CgeB
LALWGNCPLTFRFFEGLSRRCLVLAQDLSGLRFASCGLTPGVHYVAVKSDLSDLIEKASYYSSHCKDAQVIADAGFAHFKNYYAFRGVRYPAALFDEIAASWKGLLKPVVRPSLLSGILANLLPHINGI